MSASDTELSVLGHHEGTDRSYRYVRDVGTGDRTLEEPAGKRRTRSEVLQGEDLLVTERETDEHGNVFSEVVSYVDGRTSSVSGTGVVAQTTTYGVEADGSQWTRVQVGAQVERTVTDMLGRTRAVERTGYGGQTEVSQTFYNAQGQVVRVTQPGAAATLYEYDALGNQVRVVLDVNDNGSVDTAGPDRVQETDTQYVQGSGGLWQESVQRVYADSGPLVVGQQATRLTGFQGGAVAESRSTDLHGNVTSSRTFVVSLALPPSASHALS